MQVNAVIGKLREHSPGLAKRGQALEESGVLAANGFTRAGDVVVEFLIQASTDGAEAFLKLVGVIPATNTVLPELALCLFAYARDVNEGLLQHRKFALGSLLETFEVSTTVYKMESFCTL